jgi:hypothetical protein
MVEDGVMWELYLHRTGNTIITAKMKIELNEFSLRLVSASIICCSVAVLSILYYFLPIRVSKVTPEGFRHYPFGSATAYLVVDFPVMTSPAVKHLVIQFVRIT